MEPGDVASVLVSFIEDRNGRALVRLPNGSKTSLPYESLDLVVTANEVGRHVSQDDLTGGLLLAQYRPHPINKHASVGDSARDDREGGSIG
jgi:hypothetical protein